MLKNLLEFAIKQLVDHPDQVMITETNAETKTVVEINVSPVDLKRVIGKDGRIVRALRAMVNSVDGIGPVELIVK
jgi:predicted RNA-binding protein YlqC (UPF0109 family)